MTVLHRDALEASPLADLHAIASELGIDGFRRLRKAELIDRILRDSDADSDADSGADVDSGAEPEDNGATVIEEVVDEAAADEDARPKRRRGSRGGRGRGREDADRDDGDAEEADDGAQRRDETIEGVVELLGNGSGFVRVSPPEPSDGDVYISAAQVRRCELVSGDRVSGPVRRPRRSERYPSLVRVDTINGAAAEEVAAGTPFDDLPAAWPSERFALDSEDPTLKAVEWLTPIGRGSRVTIVGAARSGKSEVLRRLAGALAGQDELELTAVLLGVRPEEAYEWRQAAEDGGVTLAAALTLAAGSDAQGQALERGVDTAKRVAARGGHAVLLIDTLDGVHPPGARKALAAARNIPDGGSLTVVATASRPLGGETTVIALDQALAATGRYPAIDLVASGTLRPELLVGDAGAEEIARARADALEQR